jgi:hypothetical protein
LCLDYSPRPHIDAQQDDIYLPWHLETMAKVIIPRLLEATPATV